MDEREGNGGTELFRMGNPIALPGRYNVRPSHKWEGEERLGSVLTSYRAHFWTKLNQHHHQRISQTVPPQRDTTCTSE